MTLNEATKPTVNDDRGNKEIVVRELNKQIYVTNNQINEMQCDKKGFIISFYIIHI